MFAAEAVAKPQRRPGLAVLTAGPGVTNGISGLTSAHFNGAPVLVLGAGRRRGAVHHQHGGRPADPVPGQPGPPYLPALQQVGDEAGDWPILSLVAGCLVG